MSGKCLVQDALSRRKSQQLIPPRPRAWAWPSAAIQRPFGVVFPSEDPYFQVP